MRPRLLMFVMALGYGLGVACGGGDDDAITETNANLKAAEAWCAKIFRCKDDSSTFAMQAADYTDEAACRADKKAGLDAPNANKDEGAPCARDRRLDGAEAARCISDLRTSACSLTGFPDSCANVCRPAS